MADMVLNEEIEWFGCNWRELKRPLVGLLTGDLGLEGDFLGLERDFLGLR